MTGAGGLDGKPGQPRSSGAPVSLYIVHVLLWMLLMLDGSVVRWHINTLLSLDSYCVIILKAAETTHSLLYN